MAPERGHEAPKKRENGSMTEYGKTMKDYTLFRYCGLAVMMADPR